MNRKIETCKRRLVMQKH